jgi:phosphonate transport system substrate-binding protein
MLALSRCSLVRGSLPQQGYCDPSHRLRYGKVRRLFPRVGIRRDDASPRASRGFLRFALVTSVVILAVGQSLMWSLYTSSFQVPSGTIASASVIGEPLVVAIGRTPGGPSEWTTYAAVLGKLQEDIGRPLKIRYALTRPEITELVATRQADLAFVPTWVYLIMQEEGAAQLVAAHVIEGNKWESAAMVVSAKSDIQTLEDLRGKRMLLSPTSLPAEAYLYWLIDEHDEVSQEYFGAIISGGTQQQNLAAILDGGADATLVNRTALAKWPDEAFRVIAESPEFATPPLIARPDLDEDLLAAVKASVLGADQSNVIPEDSTLSGFAAVDDEDYAFSRVLARYLDSGTLRQSGGSTGEVSY